MVAGWASINEGTEGPPIWELVSRHLQQKKIVDLQPTDAVKVVGGEGTGRGRGGASEGCAICAAGGGAGSDRRGRVDRANQSVDASATG